MEGILDKIAVTSILMVLWRLHGRDDAYVLKRINVPSFALEVPRSFHLLEGPGGGHRRSRVLPVANILVDAETACESHVTQR